MISEEQFGEGVLKSSTIEIEKGYSNEWLWEIPLNEGSIVKSILEGANLNAAERAPLAKQESVEGLLATLSEMGSPTPKHQALLEEIQGKFTDSDAFVSVKDAIITLLPKFVRVCRVWARLRSSVYARRQAPQDCARGIAAGPSARPRTRSWWATSAGCSKRRRFMVRATGKSGRSCGSRGFGPRRSGCAD